LKTRLRHSALVTRPHPLRSTLRVPLLVVVAIVGLGASASAAEASSVRDQQSAVSFAAALDGQPLGLSSTGDPIVIDPDTASTLALTIRNNTDEPLTVRQVQMRGTAFGLRLLSYDVVVNARIAPGDRTRVDVPVEFFDLGDQVTGLLPATIRLIDPDRNELASRSFTVDVRGSSTSLMAIFTIVVAIATGASILLIWIAIGRRRLPRSRWQRGVRFALVGAGIGVTLTLFLALLLLVTPEGSVWIPLLVIPTVGAFLLGWFSPGPLADLDEETEIEDWMRQTVPYDASAGP
jgi:hypothetical protein